MRYSKIFNLLTGLILFILFILFIQLDPSNPKVSKLAGIALLMAYWWITETVPLAVTSLLPLILFPTLGILDGEQTSSSYINSTIFLFLGGFLIALAMEKWNFHKRIALKIISLFGGSPGRIILGFLSASAFISMWISNTATAVMLLPIGLAVVYQLEEKFTIERAHNLTVCILISIAYGASIGGIVTPIGTPPNLSFIRILHIVFPHAPEISFANWIIAILPISLIMLLTAWILLSKVFFRIDNSIFLDRNIIKDELKNLGPMSFEEKYVSSIFFITVILWIFRSDINFGIFKMYGWSNLVSNPTWLNDGVIAIFSSVLLFLAPSKTIQGKNILDGSVFAKVPWDIILLFGGGFALAKGFVVSGLAEYIGKGVASYGFLTPILLMLIVGLFVTFLTELTSNTATAEMILPILAAVSVALKMNPMLLMINATISVSMAFMLPVATPPNAVIFGSKRIKVKEMAKVGLFMNLIGAIIIVAVIYLFGSKIFDIDFNSIPDWAIQK